MPITRRLVGNPTDCQAHDFLRVFFCKAFEKDPVGFRMWQEGCSSTKLNIKAAFFCSFLEYSVENIVHPRYIFLYVLYITHSSMAETKISLWFLAFFLER